MEVTCLVRTVRSNTIPGFTVDAAGLEDAPDAMPAGAPLALVACADVKILKLRLSAFDRLRHLRQRTRVHCIRICQYSVVGERNVV